jgi:hypothetical protein
MSYTKFNFSIDQKKTILYILDCNREITNKRIARLGFFNRSEKKSLTALLNGIVELWRLIRISINDDGPILLDSYDNVRLVLHMGLGEVAVGDGIIILDSNQLRLLSEIQEILSTVGQEDTLGGAYTTKLITQDIYNLSAPKKLSFRNERILIGQCFYKGELLDCVLLPKSLDGISVVDEDILIAESWRNGENISVVFSKGIEYTDIMHYLAVTGRLVK